MATNDVPAAQQAEARDAVCGYLFPNTFKCILPSGHAGEHDWRISRLDPWDQKHTVKEKPDQRLWTQQEVDAELTALKSSQQQWERALVGLTPGGSEFVGDPERCTKFVEERRETLMRLFIDKKSELERLKSSQQEDIARALSMEQLQMMSAVAFDPQVGPPTERWIYLKDAIAAHLAEQAKAQEAHQNELEDVRDFKDVVIENNRKIYEQTSLASQAKLVRKCAATHCGGCKSGNVPGYGSRGLLWHLDANGIEDAICASRGTLELITPAMLQAEEAALAAEKAREGEAGSADGAAATNALGQIKYSK